MREQFGLRLKWLGCACFEFDFGGVTVVSDPWITANKKTELTWESVEHCDYITVSHGHYDHVLDIPKLAETFQSCILCGEETAMPLMYWANLNPMKVIPMYPQVETDLEQVKITPLLGRHSPLPGTARERQKIWQEHAVCDGNEDLIQLNILGDFEYRNYLFTMANGTRILQWGNLLDHTEQRGVIKAAKPDIAILQVTAKTDLDQMIDVCRQSGCKVVIPQHIDFPGAYTEAAEKLGEKMKEELPDVRFIMPEYGKWISL